MSGRILILDPIVTNRVMLKAQLTAEYFLVDVADRLETVLRDMMRVPPSVIILNYDAEAEAGFPTCKAIRANPRMRDLPIVMLCRKIEDMFWDDAYHLQVDEILPDFTDPRQLAFRLSQIIRHREVLEEQKTRQHTLNTMGFAEDGISFPPAFPMPLVVDCQHALGVMTSARIGKAVPLLKNTFPIVRFERETRPDTMVRIIDERQIGRQKALLVAGEVQQARRSGEKVPKVLFISDKTGLQDRRRVLELGADDFLTPPFSGGELASRLRRLAWLQQMRIETDNAVDAKLRLAMRDELTGLFNRRYALQYLENLTRPVSRVNSLTVMMLDLDNFKNINDRYGHPVGDAVIREAGQRIGSRLRSADMVARVGGEEFLVVLNDTPLAQAHQIAKRICAQINARPFNVAQGKSPVFASISIGMTFCDHGRIKPDRLIAQADRALLQSKGQGRNQVTLALHAA